MAKDKQGPVEPASVREGRLRAGASQKQLATALGYTKAYISNIEHGRQPITPAFRRRFLLWAHKAPALESEVSIRPVGVVVHHGALVFVASRMCGYTRCLRAFIPKVHNQDYCSLACKADARRERRHA